VALWPTEPVGLRFRLPFTVPRQSPARLMATQGPGVSVKKRGPPKMFARTECLVPERCIYSAHLCAESMR
jgi:hypothetical protein